MYYSLLKLITVTYGAQLILLDNMNDIMYRLTIFVAIGAYQFVANGDTSWSFDIHVTVTCFGMGCFVLYNCALPVTY